MVGGPSEGQQGRGNAEGNQICQGIILDPEFGHGPERRATFPSSASKTAGKKNGVGGIFKFL